MKSVPASEIIEIIEIIDVDDADWATQRGTTPHAPPDTSRRWIGPAAVATLLAAIGYGVISSAISSNDAKAPPASTSVPRTTVAGTSTSVAPTINVISPQFYVADPGPVGFTMHFAETLGMGGNTADFAETTTAQLWATDGATANSGSWFVVSRGTHHFTGRNSYRTVVGDGTAVVEHDTSSGQVRLSFNKEGGALEIDAFGWTDRQLLRLADSVYVSDSKLQFHDPFFVTDHKPLLYTDPSSSFSGVPVARVAYTTTVAASLAESFTITVAAYPQSNHDVAVRFAVADLQRIDVGDRSGIVGQSAVDPRMTIVQWRDGDRLITMRGNLDAARLVSIAETVHPAPDASVRQQVQPDPPVASVQRGEPHTVGSGWLDGPWIVQVSAASNDATTWFVWWIGQPASNATPSDSLFSVPGQGPTIETLVDHGKTYVLARVPRSMAGAKLHVNRTGLPSVELPAVDVDAGLDSEFAVYAFAEATPFAAQIVDADGQTVVSWPSTCGDVCQQPRPTSIGELDHDMQGQADHIADTSADEPHQCPAGTLHGVGAGFVHRLAGSHVPPDHRLVELHERDQGRAHLRDLDLAEPHRNAGVHSMGARRQLSQHRCRIVLVDRLAEDLAAELDGGIRGNDQLVGGGAHRRGLGEGQPAHVGLGSFVGRGRFVDVGHTHGELHPDLRQQLVTSR